MLRQPLLRLLRAHAALPLDQHEAAMAAEIIRFVETHPRCAERTQPEGHLTGSAWIVDPAQQHALLTHHRKLDKWLQLGGHADGELDLLAVALREAQEESGLTCIKPVTTAIFDVDCHCIPARGAEPEHWHYDIRFLFEADPTAPLVINSESKDLAWISLTNIAAWNPEASIRRMIDKTIPKNT